VPVLAIYGKKDQSIPMAVVEKIERWMKAHGKAGEVRVYDAGHAFMNPDHGMGDEASAQDAWPRMVHFLQSHIGKS
jgi:carboxymethylenebutenolidase